MDWLMQPDTTIEKFLVMLFAIALFALVMAAVLVLVDRPSLPRWVAAGGYLGPALLLIVMGLLIPAFMTIRNSLYNNSLSEFVGLENYVTIFTQDLFLTVLRNTFLWVLLVPLLSTALGLVYAVLVDRTRFEKFAKTLIFLPMAISMVGASIIWKFVYEYKAKGVPQTGLLNQILVWMGLEPQQFLLNAPINTFYLIIVMVWIQTGFAMTVLSAAIKAIPDETIEAANVDGATGMRLFWQITVPSVRSAIIVVLTTIAMATLKAFDIVRTMTGGQFDTSIVANEFYTQTFGRQAQGIGAALAVLLFVLVMPLIVYNVRQMRISEGER
ncbi:sugar ABC transporter permease [Propioniciclava sinopodophylli]|uniref:Sugar ABC transporter permease n=1 Tax=Propioniciclava sinopodophylli TaxID=1837344 RepID=A0A4Q9KGJ4_9ACTN|nr:MULTISPECIES: sugar ABC transporter permease [Propioniciclava]MBB1494143.1 sugar ABC transporter permease [Propioniciclava sp. MC1595]QTE25127.1 sugar ABC transporter permease [Propioniciclava sp. MC1595]TBT86517.1 sugar ABC transporter permease [Propioniciclava sinopodophylli]